MDCDHCLVVSHAALPTPWLAPTRRFRHPSRPRRRAPPILPGPSLRAAISSRRAPVTYLSLVRRSKYGMLLCPDAVRRCREESAPAAAIWHPAAGNPRMDAGGPTLGRSLAAGVHRAGASGATCCSGPKWRRGRIAPPTGLPAAGNPRVDAGGPPLGGYSPAGAHRTGASGAREACHPGPQWDRCRGAVPIGTRARALGGHRAPQSGCPCAAGALTTLCWPATVRGLQAIVPWESEWAHAQRVDFRRGGHQASPNYGWEVEARLGC